MPQSATYFFISPQEASSLTNLFKNFLNSPQLRSNERPVVASIIKALKYVRDDIDYGSLGAQIGFTKKDEVDLFNRGLAIIRNKEYFG